MVLIKNSEITKDTELYGNLFQTCVPYEKLSRYEFDKLPFDIKARFSVISDKYNLFEMIKKEWSALPFSDKATEEIHCSLCNRRNVIMCYIKNNVNENIINVGTECIKNFDGFQNVDGVIKLINKSNRDRLENKRRIAFDTIELESTANFIRNYETWFENSPLLLPYRIFNKIRMDLVSLNKLRGDYIKRDGEFEKIKEDYYVYKRNLLALKEDANVFYSENKNNPLSCKKVLGDMLKEHNQQIWEKVMRNEGIFDEETLKFAYHPEFVKDNIKTFQKCLKDEDFAILEIRDNNVYLSFQNKYHDYPILVYVTCVKFIKEIGYKCLLEKDYKFTKSVLKSIINIPNTNRNFNAITERLNDILPKYGYVIESSKYGDDKYFVRSDAIRNVEEKKNDVTGSQRTKKATNIYAPANKYLKIIDNNFYQNYKEILFKDNVETIKYFINVLKKSSNWISKEVKEDRENIAKDLSVRQQREFIKY